MIYKPPSDPAQKLSAVRPTGRPIRVLRLLLGIRETTASYNQFSLPMRGRQKITLCTFFRTEITPPREITLFQGDGTVLGFFRVLRAAMARGEYDVVHAHSPHVGCFFLMATMLRRRARRWSVCTVHTSYSNLKFRNRLMMIPVFAGFSRVVCCGQASYRSFPLWFKWLAGDRLRFIRNGVDIGRIDQVLGNGKAPVRTNRFSVVSVGRLIELKNPLILLRAFRRSAGRHARLMLLGDGPLAASLAEESKAYDLQHQVTLEGLVAREKVYETLNASDLFVSTSSIEGLPIAVLEAMACRCPVVLSDIPPHQEIADRADFIPLVPVGDVEGFARAIREFQRMSASRRAAIGEQCRRLVETRFGLPAMHRAYETIYRELVGKAAE